MITDPTPSARSCQRGTLPAPRRAGTTATQPTGKQISAAFKRVVMVISPMAKAWRDHAPGRYTRRGTRAWCRDRGGRVAWRGKCSRLGVGRKGGLHLHLDILILNCTVSNWPCQLYSPPPQCRRQVPGGPRTARCQAHTWQALTTTAVHAGLHVPPQEQRASPKHQKPRPHSRTRKVTHTRRWS